MCVVGVVDASGIFSCQELRQDKTSLEVYCYTCRLSVRIYPEILRSLVQAISEIWMKLGIFSSVAYLFNAWSVGLFTITWLLSHLIAKVLLVRFSDCCSVVIFRPSAGLWRMLGSAGIGKAAVVWYSDSIACNISIGLYACILQWHHGNTWWRHSSPRNRRHSPPPPAIKAWCRHQSLWFRLKSVTSERRRRR